MRIRKILAGLAILFLWEGPGAHAAAPDPLEVVREAYLLAAEEEAGIEQGLNAVASIRTESRLGEGELALLEAYEGALVTLRAKYVFWPMTRMRHLNQGLAVLDRLVKARPEDSEIRYLRLMSCFHLPSFLGRDGTVREDFTALARTLPGDQAAMPEELYRGIAGFVIGNGRLRQEQTRLLRASLE